LSPKEEEDSPHEEASVEKEQQGMELEEGPCHAAASPKKEQQQPSNPLESASLLSKLFFLWVWPLLKLGVSRPLQQEDLPCLLPDDTSHHNRELVLELFAMARQQQQEVPDRDNNNKSSFFFVLAKHYATSLWFAQILLVISMMARIGQVLAFQRLLDQLEQTRDDADPTVYYCATIMIVCGAIVFLCKQQQFFLTYRKGVQLRLGLVAAIYSKAHTLPSASSGVSAGQISNLASNDVERYLMATVVGFYLWWGPFESLLILGVGITIIGPAFAAGFGLFMTVLLPLQFYLSQLFAKVRHQVATDTDARISLVSQAISGARVMKMNAWEWQLEKKISDCRAREVRKITRSCRYVGNMQARAPGLLSVDRKRRS
jgi:ABC transporter transmembrane region